MNPTRLPDNDSNAAARCRLRRLARYRAMQRNLDFELRQQVSRQRLLALHRGSVWGWVAL